MNYIEIQQKSSNFHTSALRGISGFFKGCKHISHHPIIADKDFKHKRIKRHNGKPKVSRHFVIRTFKNRKYDKDA